MKTNAEVQIAQNTTGSYFIRIDSAAGTVEVNMTPEEFAKAITGKLAKATTVD